MDFTSPACLVPKAACSQLFLYGDVRTLIFEFIGVNQDLATCRLVCQDWNVDIQRFIETVFRMKKFAIDMLRPSWEELHRNMSSVVKETIEIFEVRRAVFESFDGNVFYRSMRMLAKINKPSQTVHDGVLAVMNLLTEETELTELKDNGGALDWKFFKKKMLNRNFLKSLRSIKPEDISTSKIVRFEAAVGLEMVTEYDQLFASREARDVYTWAMNMVEYKEFLDTITPDVKSAIKETKVQKIKEDEFRTYETIMRKLNKSVRC